MKKIEWSEQGNKLEYVNNFDLQVSKIEKNEQIEISKDWLARKQLKFERIISLTRWSD